MDVYSFVTRYKGKGYSFCLTGQSAKTVTLDFYKKIGQRTSVATELTANLANRESAVGLFDNPLGKKKTINLMRNLL